jgi:DNA helicase-2/ATP-dependent DNA helicase PcrA|tara:strand:- start:4315 stop:5838 length:1524 start_codon:yes stop_codon:yes gene_type:complete
MFRYFGPPGTGKTTTLLNQVDELLSKGMSPNEIGYFAFTRKAAHEARDRAVSRFNLDPEKDFMYFRTLHSLAFKVLGLTGAQILGDKALRGFSEEAGSDLCSGGAERISDDGFNVMKSNNPIMRAIDLARNTLKGPGYAYNAMELPIPFYEFEHLYKEYERFKEFKGLKDFTDMMVDLSNNPGSIPFLKVVFLDEAQDLTPLQWKVAHHLSDRSDRMFVAGDDDQGIYRWAGADINHFVSLPGGSEVLSQSYRVPRSVHRVADSIVGRIRNRQKKTWMPRQEEGSVEKTYDANTVSFGDGEWLILAQANYMLDELADRMTSSGHYFERKGSPSLKRTVRNAISSWNHLQSSPGHEVSLSEAVNLYDHMSSGAGRLKRGAKKMLSGADQEDLFTMEVLRLHFGLETPADTWDVALDRIVDEDRAYASALLNRGINIFEKPKIKLSTIHGAKGGEADNVLLFTDLSGKALKEMEKNPDDAHRVLYVGLTRAKQNLVLKMPEDSQRGWSI